MQSPESSSIATTDVSPCLEILQGMAQRRLNLVRTYTGNPNATDISSLTPLDPKRINLLSFRQAYTNDMKSFNQDLAGIKCTPFNQSNQVCYGIPGNIFVCPLRDLTYYGYAVPSQTTTSLITPVPTLNLGSGAPSGSNLANLEANL